MSQQSNTRSSTRCSQSTNARAFFAHLINIGEKNVRPIKKKKEKKKKKETKQTRKKGFLFLNSGLLYNGTVKKPFLI